MKTIGIYFREIKLGELTQINTNYVYKANSKNVEKAHNKGYSTFLYNCDNSFIDEHLPISLQNFIPSKEQTELEYLANIKEDDSDFEKLYKIAKLNFDTPDFYIKA